MDIGGAASSVGSVREEVRHLVGIRWDNLIEWALVVTVGSWWWFALWSGFWIPARGPLEALNRALDRIALAPPAWVADLPAWLADHAILLPLWIVGSALSATLSGVSVRRSGLRVLALVLAVAAIESAGSWWPMLGILLGVLVPALAAIVAGRVENAGSVRDAIAVELVPRILFRIVTVYPLPVAMPFVVVTAAVNAYRLRSPWEPARELVELLLDRSEESGGGARRMTSATLVLVAALLSGRRDAESMAVVAALHRSIAAPVGARDVRGSYAAAATSVSATRTG